MPDQSFLTCAAVPSAVNGRRLPPARPDGM